MMRLFVESRPLILPVAFAWLVSSVSGAYSSVITENFTIHVTSGCYCGTVGTGAFSYDPANLVYHPVPANGAYVTPELGTLSISLDIFGQSFTEADDMDFPVRPYFQLSGDGVPITLDYAISEKGNQGILGPDGNQTAIDQPGISIFYMSSLVPVAGGGFTIGASAVCVPVPLPFSGALLGIASGLFILRRRQRPVPIGG